MRLGDADQLAPSNCEPVEAFRRLSPRTSTNKEDCSASKKQATPLAGRLKCPLKTSMFKEDLGGVPAWLGRTLGCQNRVSVWTKATSGSTAQMQLWVHDTLEEISAASTATTPGTSWQQVTGRSLLTAH